MSTVKAQGAAQGRMANPTFRRRLAIRSGLCAAAVALGAFSMVVGRGHSIVLDDMRPKDGSLQAPRMLSAVLDGKKPVELSAGVREVLMVTGQKHTLVVDWLDGSAPAVEEFSIDFAQDFMILSFPRLKAGVRPWLEPFFPYAPAAQAEERAATAEADAAIPKP